MIKNIIKITIVGVTFLFNSYTLASDESELTQLKDYLLAKEFTQAYEYSKSLEFELAGELTYDFLSGLAAFGAEHYQEAIFAFERVVINDPSAFDGRYYLALSYQKVDNLHAAVTEFELLLANASTTTLLTAAQLSKVKYQLQLTKEKLVDLTRSWSHEIMLGIGSDNNINSGSSLNDITLPDGTLIPLFDSSKKIADESYSALYHVNYKRAFSQYQWLLVDFSAQDISYFSHKEYNRQMLNFEVKYKHELIDNSSWYLGLKIAPLWYSKHKHLSQNAITFGWQQPINKTSQYGLNGLIANINQFVYKSLDFKRYQMNVFYRFQSTLLHTFVLNWYQDTNKKGLDHNNKRTIGASYIANYSILDHLSGSTMVMYGKETYEQPNPFFSEYNDSVSTSISTDLVYTGFDKHMIKLQLNYHNKQVDSQLLAMKIFEYNRFDSNITWKYAF